MQANVRCVRLRARVNTPEDVDRWQDAGATHFILQLLSPLPAQAKVSPVEYLEYYSAEIQAFLKQENFYLEIHDEPNRFDRGAGVSWLDGDDFSLWFFELQHLLHRRFGESLLVGFPALYPTGKPQPVSAHALDESVFLEQCADAMATADWVAIHTYWRSYAEMVGYEGALRFLRLYMERLPTQQFVVTEFANVDVNVPSGERGVQYAEFYTAMAQYDQIRGACCLLLRSSDPLYDPLAWLHPDGRPRPLLSQVVERPPLPDPQQIRMHWPTAYHQYHQYFGAHQTEYNTLYGLGGGHNGVDLHVDHLSPETSPVYAALTGTVTHVALESAGYGYHVRIRSYAAGGTEMTLAYAHLSTVDVTVGMLVEKGDRIGFAGSTGNCRSPHVHLGMRVKGVRNGSVDDWLNPRPYLESLT